MRNMLSILKKVLGKSHMCNCSYSQEGEDILLNRIIGNINFKGSFVDIGAHHPVKYSNTYKFYQAGWRGINIEANPGSMKAFNEIRPEDINIEMPVSDREEELTFYMFNHPELNTFSRTQALDWDGKFDVRLREERKLKTSTLNKILKENSPGRNEFDLLSIDVEGMDLRIIKSIDFSEIKFRFIIAEDELNDIVNVTEGEMYRYLTSRGYRLVSKLFYSSIYQLDERP